jgi:hypothetical protein
MEICIDFDGTCVTHEYPEIGKSIGAEPVLKALVENGHQLILFTMRSDRKVEDGAMVYEETFLSDAVNWFERNNIPIYGIQQNPTQMEWTNSPKAYGQLYIDDAALGCPLIYPEDIQQRPFVDWEKVSGMLKSLQLL